MSAQLQQEQHILGQTMNHHSDFVKQVFFISLTEFILMYKKNILFSRLNKYIHFYETK